MKKLNARFVVSILLVIAISCLGVLPGASAETVGVTTDLADRINTYLHFPSWYMETEGLSFGVYFYDFPFSYTDLAELLQEDRAAFIPFYLEEFTDLSAEEIAGLDENQQEHTVAVILSQLVLYGADIHGLLDKFVHGCKDGDNAAALQAIAADTKSRLLEIADVFPAYDRHLVGTVTAGDMEIEVYCIDYPVWIHAFDVLIKEDKDIFTDTFLKTATGLTDDELADMNKSQRSAAVIAALECLRDAGEGVTGLLDAF